jgi:iron complex outermembrane receptor protein
VPIRYSLNRAAAASPLCLLRACAWLTAVVAASSGFAAVQVAASDLADLTLEQLGNVVVTTVSRRPELVRSAPASVFVISSEDIRRSGVTSLPEALRLAPNLQVARADTNQYGITARGSNSTLANKMLVMVDGRTVYSPIFSGVFWESVDVMLEDIERIEVISGPGSTLWGINAVNGVINVITRSAGDTRGLYAEAGGGNAERGANVRYGTHLGPTGALRAYGKFIERDSSTLRSGAAINDESDRWQIGFRYDDVTPARTFTLQGDVYDGRIEQSTSTRETSGANVLSRWTQPLSEGSDLTVQAYLDHSYRLHPGLFEQRLDTVDATVQYGTRALAGHRLVVGAGYRHARDRVNNPSPALAFIPADKSLGWANVFAQDEIELRRDVRLILGAKVETNVYTGAEFLPNLRLAWEPEPTRLVWGALTRAVRAPARIDRDFYQPAQPPHVLLAGGPDFKSEIANVAELGYREQFGDRFYLSATTFYNDFDRLRSVEPRPGGPRLENQLEGEVYGVESWAEWRALPNWRLAAGAVYQRVSFEREAGSADTAGLASLAFDPSGWWLLRSNLDLPYRVEFDAMVRRVGHFVRSAVAGYTAIDARLGWRASRSLELSVTVQNALGSEHSEWGPVANPAEFSRSAFFRATWHQ